LAENGVLFVATINRNLKSLLCAKFAVEYILRWLPIGTHSWHKFLKPSEINEIANKYGLQLLHLQGFSYNILNDYWKESSDIDINYCLVFA
jgi:2-polyprenyl-6-hydroxyphenyl methylase/3-demethylubiquinone-9 3-methyltransferase